MKLKTLVGTLALAFTTTFANAQQSNLENYVTQKVDTIIPNLEFVDSIEVNTDPTRIQYFHGSWEDGLRMLYHGAKNAKKEEAVIFLPNKNIWVEVGYAEKPDTATIDSFRLLELGKLDTEMRMVHIHRCTDGSRLSDKIPSIGDLSAYFEYFARLKERDSTYTFSGHHVSCYGLTSYTAQDDREVDDLVRYYHNNDTNLIDLQLQRLSFLIFDSFMDSVLQTVEVPLYDDGDSTKMRRDMDFLVDDGFLSPYLYIEFTPMDSYGRLIGRKEDDFKGKTREIFRSHD